MKLVYIKIKHAFAPMSLHLRDLIKEVDKSYDQHIVIQSICINYVNYMIEIEIPIILEYNYGNNKL